jgi:aspartate/tyrosine/aromatic aminotransferase
MTMLESITPAPPDSILGLTEAWRKDPNPAKINLGVGVYKDHTGATPILKSVKEAERRLLETATTKSYMPIGGAPEYGRLVQETILGADHEALAAGRVRTAHTPGGTAALRVGADFIHKFNPRDTVWLSRPTWANHKGVFAAAGLNVAEYAYYQPATHGLDEAAFLAALDGIPAGDVVVLHACCHNPTGVDLHPAHWEQVASMARRRGWIPFLDFAYQGYGDGLAGDRAALLALAGQCPELWVASSFSKNFGLYQDRTGALSLVAPTARAADAAFSQVEACIRVNYSNPPAHGGLIVTTILADPGLRAQWEQELNQMRERIADVREKFAARLGREIPGRDFDFIRRQRGMFSFSGLTDTQVSWLREQRSIYIVGGGRINVAGVTDANLDYLGRSIAEAVQQG